MFVPWRVDCGHTEHRPVGAPGYFKLEWVESNVMRVCGQAALTPSVSPDTVTGICTTAVCLSPQVRMNSLHSWCPAGRTSPSHRWLSTAAWQLKWTSRGMTDEPTTCWSRHRVSQWQDFCLLMLTLGCRCVLSSQWGVCPVLSDLYPFTHRLSADCLTDRVKKKNTKIGDSQVSSVKPPWPLTLWRPGAVCTVQLLHRREWNSPGGHRWQCVCWRTAETDPQSPTGRVCPFTSLVFLAKCKYIYIHFSLQDSLKFSPEFL